MREHVCDDRLMLVFNIQLRLIKAKTIDHIPLIGIMMHRQHLTNAWMMFICHIKLTLNYNLILSVLQIICFDLFVY